MDLGSENMNDEHWDLIITPKFSTADFRFKDFMRYKGLFLSFLKRDFVASYQQTLLGPIWHILQPLLTTVMMVIVFGKIAKIPTDTIPPVIFYLSGVTIWSFFANTLTSASVTLLSNSGIFGKVYFPRIIPPLVQVVSNMIKFFIQFSMLVSVILWFHFFKGFYMHFTFNLLFLIPLLFLVGLTALGLGLLVSAMTAKYRDLSILLTFGIQLLMYITPIVYPVSFLINKPFRFLIIFNPLTTLVELYRWILFGQGTFSSFFVWYSIGFMCFVLLVGFVLYKMVERTFIDEV